MAADKPWCRKYGIVSSLQIEVVKMFAKIALLVG
jgi:hypothetical protein